MDKQPKDSNPAYTLRKATADDYRLAESLYLESMKPLLSALNAWVEAEAVEKFKGYYNIDEVEIILVGDDAAGWLQVTAHPQKIELTQIHLREIYRTKGIGTQIVRQLQAKARRAKKPLCLEVVHGNPAIALYKRLNFTVVSETETKLQMCWESD